LALFAFFSLRSLREIHAMCKQQTDGTKILPVFNVWMYFYRYLNFSIFPGPQKPVDIISDIYLRDSSARSAGIKKPKIVNVSFYSENHNFLELSKIPKFQIVICVTIFNYFRFMY